MQWGFEEGVLDLGLLVVLFYERCRDDISEGQSLAVGMASLGVCLEARLSPVFGSVGCRGARMENALGKARGF